MKHDTSLEKTDGTFEVLAYSDEKGDAYVQVIFGGEDGILLCFPIVSARRSLDVLAAAIHAVETGEVAE